MDNIESQVKFFDSQAIRSVSSPDFNFALDKESGVSICWGIDQSEDPLYDPISPQQIKIYVDNTTTLYDIINTINLLGNIKQQKQLNVKYTAIPPINNQTDLQTYTKFANVKVIGTLCNVQLIISETAVVDDLLNNITPLVKYLNKLHIRLNIYTKQVLTKEHINKLKFVTSNVSIDLTEQTIDCYKELLSNKFTSDVVINIMKDNFQAYITLLEQLPKECIGVIYLVEPLISYVELKNLQGRINNLKLDNLFLRSCNLVKFNKSEDKPFEHTIEIITCEHSTFSIFVKNNKVYKCQFGDTPILTLDFNKSVNDVWYDLQYMKFRQQIVQKSYC